MQTFSRLWGEVVDYLLADDLFYRITSFLFIFDVAVPFIQDLILKVYIKRETQSRSISCIPQVN